MKSWSLRSERYELADQCCRSVVYRVAGPPPAKAWACVLGVGDELADCLVLARARRNCGAMCITSAVRSISISKGIAMRGSQVAMVRRDPHRPTGRGGPWPRRPSRRVRCRPATATRGGSREVRVVRGYRPHWPATSRSSGSRSRSSSSSSWLCRSRFADDLDDPALARTSALGALEQDSQLCVAPDERQPALLLGLVPGLVHDGRMDRRGLAFTRKGSSPSTL